jgi:hypothetical protein
MGRAAEPYRFGVTINYTHQLALTRKVHAVYNLKDVYSYVVRSGKSGGLFSRKSWTEVIESRDIDELMNIQMEFPDDVTDEVIERERKLAREMLLGSAIADMQARLSPAPDPGKSGATIAAEQLTKTCGLNAYCAGAAAALTVLDGIFGRSKSTASLLQTLDVSRTYDSQVTEAVDVPGAISFTVVN